MPKRLNKIDAPLERVSYLETKRYKRKGTLERFVNEVINMGKYNPTNPKHKSLRNRAIKEGLIKTKEEVFDEPKYE